MQHMIKNSASNTTSCGKQYKGSREYGYCWSKAECLECLYADLQIQIGEELSKEFSRSITAIQNRIDELKKISYNKEVSKLING